MCSCGYAAKIPESFIGQKLRCPKCTNLIDTAAPAASASPPASPAPAPASVPAPEAVPAVGKLCMKCKRSMREDQLVCLHCGERVAESESARIERKIMLEHQAGTNEVNDLGKKAIMWSLAGFITCIPVLGIVGIIHGFQSLSRSRAYQLPTNGMAIGALAITGVQVSGLIVWFLVFVLSIQAGMRSSEEIGERIGEGLPMPAPQIQPFSPPGS
jgi:hypothetical protein